MSKKKSPIKLLLNWAGNEKYWMYLAVVLSFFSGLCTMVPYYGIYRLIDAVYTHTCTAEFIRQNAVMIAIAVFIRNHRT